MTLAIQAYLRDGGTIASLETDLGITTKHHRDYPSLVCFRYDQLASPTVHPIVRECRGIILDEARDWAVVSYAFSRFLNDGQHGADEIDWSTARVQEKVDGSLAVLYPYGGRWHVATKGTPDASGNVHGSAQTFEDYFWETFYWHNSDLPDPSCGICFYFELCGPQNRIVVVHSKPSLTLLGARDLRFLQELPLANASALLPDIPPVREYPLTSVKEIVESFAAISPLSQEGYVVVDAEFRRIKIKHPGYVALHHAKDGMGPRAFVEIARSGETSEVAIAFPEYGALIDEAKVKVDALVSELEADYARLAGIASQKDFAIEAVKTRCSSALFAVRAKKAASIRAFVRDYAIDRLIALLGVTEAPAKEAA